MQTIGNKQSKNFQIEYVPTRKSPNERLSMDKETGGTVCQDDWHLGWQGLIKKYGEEEAEKRYRFYRSCPSGCGARIDPGD